MLFDELRELAKMPLLLKHLTPELGLSHHPVEVWWNDPIKRTSGGEKKKRCKRLGTGIWSPKPTVRHRPARQS